MFGKIENEPAHERMKWTRDEIFRLTSSKTTKLLSKKKEQEFCGNRRDATFTSTIPHSRFFCSFIASFFSFLFHFHVSKHVCRTFYIFFYAMFCSISTLCFSSPYFWMSWQIELATQSGYTRKYLDAFFASKRRRGRRWRRRKKRHGCLMERWKAREYSKENKKCEVNVRDIVFNALVHLDYHYADCV